MRLTEQPARAQVIFAPGAFPQLRQTLVSGDTFVRLAVALLAETRPADSTVILAVECHAVGFDEVAAEERSGYGFVGEGETIDLIAHERGVIGGENALLTNQSQVTLLANGGVPVAGEAADRAIGADSSGHRRLATPVVAIVDDVSLAMTKHECAHK